MAMRFVTEDGRYVQAFQFVVPFTFNGKLFPADGWILIGVADGYRTALTNAMAQHLFPALRSREARQW